MNVKLQKSSTPKLVTTGAKGFSKPQRVDADRASFESLFMAPMPDPLEEITPPDDPEQASLLEAQTIREAFQRKYRGELDRFRLMDDPDYWFLVCFQTREQKERFLALTGWDKCGGTRYLNGLELARILGLDIQPVKLIRQTAKPVAKILESAVTEVNDATQS